jgi:hypothetical protein
VSSEIVVRRVCCLLDHLLRQSREAHLNFNVTSPREHQQQSLQHFSTCRRAKQWHRMIACLLLPFYGTCARRLRSDRAITCLPKSHPIPKKTPVSPPISSHRKSSRRLASRPPLLSIYARSLAEAGLEATPLLSPDFLPRPLLPALAAPSSSYRLLASM